MKQGQGISNREKQFISELKVIEPFQDVVIFASQARTETSHALNEKSHGRSREPSRVRSEASIREGKGTRRVRGMNATGGERGEPSQGRDGQRRRARREGGGGGGGNRAADGVHRSHSTHCLATA